MSAEVGCIVWYNNCRCMHGGCRLKCFTDAYFNAPDLIIVENQMLEIHPTEMLVVELDHSGFGFTWKPDTFSLLPLLKETLTRLRGVPLALHTTGMSMFGFFNWDVFPDFADVPNATYYHAMCGCVRFQYPDVDECAAGVCKNGASCTNSFGGYSCQCPPGITGTNCETSRLFMWQNVQNIV